MANEVTWRYRFANATPNASATRTPLTFEIGSDWTTIYVQAPGSACAFGNFWYTSGVDHIMVEKRLVLKSTPEVVVDLDPGYLDEQGPDDPFLYRSTSHNLEIQARTLVTPKFLHGDIPEGVTVTPTDEFELDEESGYQVVVNGDPAVRYKVLVNDQQLGDSFLGFAFRDVDVGWSGDQTCDVEVDNSIPIVEEPNFTEGLRLVLFGMDGGADSSGTISIAGMTEGELNVIPGSGTIGVSPSIEAGFWKQIGLRSVDGQAMPPGMVTAMLYSKGVWIDVASWSIGDNQHSTGVSDCFIAKNTLGGETLPREFKLHYVPDVNPATPGPELPTDGGTADAEDHVTPEADPLGVEAERPTPTDPPTWEEIPGITEADTEACPCSPWYVDIAEMIEWAGHMNSLELEYIGDSIQDHADTVHQVGERIRDQLVRIADALEELVDKPPVEVSVGHESGCYAQYPGSFEDRDQFMDSWR